MSFKSILDKIGADVKGVFNFLGSSKGQTIIATGEGVVEAVVPGSVGLINLVNKWLTQAITSEALAAAAGEQQGSGTQKAAMVLAAVTPDALAFAKANGLATPTADSLAKANTALVAFLNSFGTVPTA